VIQFVHPIQGWGDAGEMGAFFTVALKKDEIKETERVEMEGHGSAKQARRTPSVHPIFLLFPQVSSQ